MIENTISRFRVTLEATKVSSGQRSFVVEVPADMDVEDLEIHKLEFLADDEGWNWECTCFEMEGGSYYRTSDDVDVRVARDAEADLAFVQARLQPPAGGCSPV